MLPNAGDSLAIMAGYMGKEMVPRIADSYTGSMTALISGLLLMISHEHEHAADNFVAENDAIRSLFARWSAEVGDPALRGRLEALAGTATQSYRLSVLGADNRRLREALSEFHAWVEDAGEALRSADEEIWRLYAEVREREKIEHVLDLFNSPG